MGSTTSTTDFRDGAPPPQRCHWHPDRETALGCSSCGRPICVDCATQTPVGMRCPDCAGERTRVITRARIQQRSTFDIAPVTVVLIAVNVAAFIAELATGFALTGLGGALTGSALRNGAFFGPAVAAGDWWRVVSSGFLHLGLFHIAMNMLLLWMLGRMLEPAIGSLRFGVIYAVSLVAGSLGSLALEPMAATVGASGAVFGLMGASLVAARSRGINPFESGIAGLILINLMLTFAVPGIAKGGHIGGLIGGVVAGVLMIELDETRQIFGRGRAGAWIAAAVGVALAAGVFAATIALAINKFPGVA